jgi:DNA invertase Pin-like site-specific DNA recombinase
LFANCNNQRFHQLGYNICRVAGSTLGLKYSAQAKANVSKAQKGRKHSNITKAKIQKANRKKKRSLQTRLRMSKAKQGEKHPNARLTKLEVDKIKKLIALGVKQHIVAKKFNVTQQTISRIKTGKRWRCINE